MEYVGSTLMALLSECNLLHDVGYLESGLTASCESIVFGNEVIEFVRRMLQPVTVNENTLAVDMNKRAGPGGLFLMEGYTLKHLRDFWYSSLVDRLRYDAWNAAGRPALFDRLTARTRDIFASHVSQPLACETVSEIDDFIAAQDTRAISQA